MKTGRLTALRALRVDGVAREGGGDEIVVDDPSTGAVVARMRGADAADVDAAVTSAAIAAAAWSARPPAERAALCREVAAAIRADAGRLAEIVVHDAGLPLKLARRDAAIAARYFEYYAGVAETLGGQTLATDVPGLALTLREPWGVCGIVLPFNVPLQMAARDLAPALAMGNAVVLKPAEQAPFGPLALVETCWRAGASPGLVAAVAGTGAQAGESLVGHPAVAHVTFTGSVGVGARVMAQAARRVLPTTIELGGKSPHVVFADADVDAVARAAVGACMPTAGQACSSGTRVLVERSRYDQLRDLLVDRIAAIEVGPAADDPQMGPLISARQRDHVLTTMRAAIAAGAQVAAGGPGPVDAVPAEGYYVRPTLLTGVAPDNPAAVEEIFGPVIAMLPFDTDEEAVALANDTEFGLVAGVWTTDVRRAVAVARRIQAGQVFVNGYGVGGGVALPFGGMKRSGVGRVKGVDGALEYTQVKTLVIAA